MDNILFGLVSLAAGALLGGVFRIVFDRYAAFQESRGVATSIAAEISGLLRLMDARGYGRTLDDIVARLAVPGHVVVAEDIRLHLGWSPIVGQWCVVQVEPLRIVDDADQRLSGTLARLSFHCGGKLVRAYERAELEKMGLVREVTTLVHERPRDFLVRGIEQIPTTNHYVLAIDSIDAGGGRVTTRLDMLTGQPFVAR